MSSNILLTQLTYNQETRKIQRSTATILFQSTLDKNLFQLTLEYLCFDDGSSRRLQDLALASSGLDGSLGRLGESMRLHSDVLGGEFFSANNNLVNGVLGLGDSLGLEKRVD